MTTNSLGGNERWSQHEDVTYGGNMMNAIALMTPDPAKWLLIPVIAHLPGHGV
ncbi:MAG: hypothetical protein JOY92_12760 [Verrucomicrobia bacterium]|nr:hypothetical protein [Verrucomicrobiota bacterium]